MYLTDEQQAVLNGEKGEVLAKVVKTLDCSGGGRPESLRQPEGADPHCLHHRSCCEEGI